MKLTKLLEIIMVFLGKALNIFLVSCFLWIVWNKLDWGEPLFGLRGITLVQSIIVITLIDIVAGRFGVNDKKDDK